MLRVERISAIHLAKSFAAHRKFVDFVVTETDDRIIAVVVMVLFSDRVRPKAIPNGYLLVDKGTGDDGRVDVRPFNTSK